LIDAREGSAAGLKESSLGAGQKKEGPLVKGRLKKKVMAGGYIFWSEKRERLIHVGAREALRLSAYLRNRFHQGQKKKGLSG